MCHSPRDSAVENTEFSSGYESFKETFSRAMEADSAKINTAHALVTSWLYTELGPMLAIADEHTLYLLEFEDRRGLAKEIDRLRQKTTSSFILGRTPPINSIEKELKAYFKGTLRAFTTPISLLGSPFQKEVWDQLLQIPSGETKSYLEIAQAIGKPTASRAVAQAVGANRLAIVIPCHRVINTDGKLGGYAGGLTRKQWLLNNEKHHKIV